VRFQDLRKEFVANVSHELRTPLTAIKGYAETLRSGALGDAAKASQFLSIIEKHADQLTNLVGDLLELSKLESAPGLPCRAPVDLAAVVSRAVELVGLAAKTKGHDLRVQIDPAVPPVPGNADYLERAVTNLLDNAIKYTPPGGRITITAGRDGDCVLIEVTDNGIGIPAEDQPRIFERFYRVDRSRSREMGGTGLGLSIVKHVAQVHRGNVEVSSSPGQGSTFRLRFPMAPR
jgi:two-component system phosphate regulon sensor histidine kinase PhoR